MLQVFVTVVEAMGMTAAAKRLSTTQSGVSQAVRGLERDLGVSLFDRNVRPMAMTPSGKVLYDGAKQLLNSASELSQLVREPAKAAVPHLRIGLIHSVAATIGPLLVPRLSNLAFDRSIWSGMGPSHRQAMLAREVDIIITAEPLDDMEGFERHPILEEPLVLALPKHYDGPCDSLNAIAGSLDLVRFTERSLLGQRVESHLRRLRFPLQRRLEFDTAETVLGMVAGGVGWSMVTPLCMLHGVVHLPRVRCAPLPSPGLTRTLTLVARKDEFADLPHRIACTSRDIVRDHCLPAIEQFAPWVVSRMHVSGEDPEQAFADLTR